MHAKFTFGLDGSSPFMKPALDALGEVLEPFFQSDEWEEAPDYFADPPALYLNRSPQAMSGLEIFGVVFCFIGTCFAKKIFDEVYERTLKRPVGACLDRFFEKAKVPEGKAVEYRDIIYFEDIDVAVVIRALAAKEMTAQVQVQVMHGHRVAHAYIETHGRRAPVHCHKIVDGHVASEPEFFENLEAIKRQARSQLNVTWRK